MGSIRFRSGSSPAAVLRGRRPRVRWARSAAFPQVAPKARIWRTFLVSFYGILRKSWHQLKACPRRDHMVSPRYPDFAICLCGGMAICQWYRVCDAGALRAEPLATLYILRGHKGRGPWRAVAERTPSAPSARWHGHRYTTPDKRIAKNLSPRQPPPMCYKRLRGRRGTLLPSPVHSTARPRSRL